MCNRLRGAPASILQVSVQLVQELARQHHELVQPQLVNAEPLPLHGPGEYPEVLQGTLCGMLHFSQIVQKSAFAGST